MSQGIEPMTAAELERIATQCERSQCQHAADYRRAAARIRELEAHARLGSLVAAIREHQCATGNSLYIYDRTPGCGGTWASGLSDAQLAETLSHLDSLLPKEPEVVDGPSGDKYRVRDGKVECLPLVYDDWIESRTIPLADAPVVAALLDQEGKDG